MMEDFTIPVNYKGKEYQFPAKMLNYGYVVKLQVTIEGTELIFEPDEERNWRALISFEEVQANKKLDTELLKAIAEVIAATTQ